MPDLSFTPSLLVPGEGAQLTNAIAGANLVAGLVCTFNASGQAVLAAATSVASAAVRGIAAGTSTTGQPCRLFSTGTIDFGADVLSPGRLYYLSSTAGGIMTEADLVAGNVTTQLGMALSARVLQLRIWSSGIVRG